MKIEMEARITWYDTADSENEDYGPTKAVEVVTADSNSEPESSPRRADPKWVSCDELKEALFSTFGSMKPENDIMGEFNREGWENLEYGTEIWPVSIIIDGNPMDEGDSGLKYSFGYWKLTGQTKDSVEFESV